MLRLTPTALALRQGCDTSGDPMDDASLKAEIKQLIVKELNLEGRDPASIVDDAPLFGAAGAAGAPSGPAAGLGLDSLDALQLAMSIEERYGVRIPEGDEARGIFASVTSLAKHVLAAKGERG